MARSKNFWTAAQTHFGEEQRAAHHVEKQDFEYYLPEMLTATARGDRRELMFPGYIFVRVAAHWRALASTKGIFRLFMCGESPTRIPEHEISYLRSCEDERGFVQPLPPLSVGDRVLAREGAGAFEGALGVVREMTTRNRVLVLLNLLGRSVQVELDRKVVELA